MYLLNSTDEKTTSVDLKCRQYRKGAAKAQVVSSTVGGFMGEDWRELAENSSHHKIFMVQLFITPSIGALMRTLSTLSRFDGVGKEHNMRLKINKLGLQENLVERN
jgi:hypothetical protein